MSRNALTRLLMATIAAAVCALSGCSGLGQWWHNGLKVGPEYCGLAAEVSPDWQDKENPKLKSEWSDHSHWWTAFNDPLLDRLVYSAYIQNLPLQIAGLRVLEARAQRGIAAGNLYPQQQQVTASYSRNRFSENMYPFGAFPGVRPFDDWMAGFDMAWELDLWGRIRRGIEAADAHLESQVEGYDDALVMLQSEVAAAYIQLRVIEEQLRYTRKNVELQRASFDLIQKRFELGVVGELDVRQAGAELAITESLVPQLEQAHRQVQNGLCLLLDMPPGSLREELAEPRPIPVPPAEVAIGIPADLLRRRPDVRQAERQAAAQSARIGIAEAEFYPSLAITGTISFEAEQFGDLFRWESRGGRIGPGLQWNVLNYGRIRNRVRIEDARFQQAVLAYQNTVLVANKEAEDALVAYLREQQRLRFLEQATQETVRALEIGLRLYEQGVVDYQRVLDSQRATVLQQDTLAQSRGKVALNLVSVYKALGGGWTMRFEPGVSYHVEPTPAGLPYEPLPPPALPTGPIPGPAEIPE
jgi:NodT family efflux transporter outer membrane factor (OMF) lipoprotein